MVQLLHHSFLQLIEKRTGSLSWRLHCVRRRLARDSLAGTVGLETSLHQEAPDSLGGIVGLETSLRQEARDSLAGTVGLETSLRQEARDSLAGTVGLWRLHCVRRHVTH